MVAEHIMQDVQDDISSMTVCTILLEKCIHMPCSLNYRNDLTLQFLQMPVVVMLLFTKMGPVSPC